MNYFDLHCDTAYQCYFKKRRFSDNSLAVSSPGGKCFGQWKQTFAIWVRDDVKEPFSLYQHVLSNFKKELEEKPANLTPIFSVEGGTVIGEDINLLYKLKDDGIKFMTLTWNGENRIAGGSKTHAGMTHFGKKVILKMNELHMATDLSHLNDKSFFSAIDIAEYPIATHSNSRAVCGVPRNLTDEQLKLIAEKGGLIGLCFYPCFLGENVYEKIYENIFCMLDLGLEDNIAIGSDFDGADMDNKLDNISKVPLLNNYLCEKGLSQTVLEKIFYKNADNYIRNL